MVLTLPLPAGAQDPPTITIRKGDTVEVALTGISGQAADILKSDLEMSGVVKLAPADAATYRVSGQATGGGVSGNVVDNRGSTVLSSAYRGDLRSAVHQFADDIVETLTGRPGIASSKIAFVSNKTGRKEIYLCDYDGNNLTQLTRDNAISVAPALNADATKLAYTGYHSGYADIYVIDLRSGARSRVVKFPGTNSGASFSPDGGRIACTVSKDGNPELYVMRSGGGGAKRLTKSRGVEASPSWSPDGDEIVFTSDDRGSPQLYRIPARGGGPKRISTGYNYCTEPSWSPDGRRIAFNIREGGFKVAVLDLQRGGVSVLTGGGAENPSWGADSRHLVYAEGSSLVVMDSETGERRTIVSGLGKISEPSWSR